MGLFHHAACRQVALAIIGCARPVEWQGGGKAISSDGIEVNLTKARIARVPFLVPAREQDEGPDIHAATGKTGNDEALKAIVPDRVRDERVDALSVVLGLKRLDPVHHIGVQLEAVPPIAPSCQF